MNHHTKQKTRYTQLLLVIVAIILAAFLLTPRYWEPGGESWKQWAAARTLRDTGGFPVLGLGPLYVVYLQVFSFLDYPLSIQLEYILTHLFAYLSIYFMLQRFTQSRYALLLTIVWIPRIAIIEPGGVVAGIGFLSLYLMQCKSVLQKEDYFPPTLIAAALCHTAYVPFLGGHFIGMLVKKWKNRMPIIIFPKKLNATLTIQVGFVILILLVIIFPSTDYHNHMLQDTTYFPIEYEGQITDSFFVAGNNNYANRNFPKSEQIYQDWYFTHNKAYGNAHTILQAIIKRPDTVIQNIITNMRVGIQMPVYFFVGKFLGLMSVIFWILPLLGFIGLFQQFKKQTPLILSITFGTLAIFGVLTLTDFGTRYIITLLPVALLMLCHVGLGLQYIIKSKLGLRFTRFFVVTSAILLFLTTQYPLGNVNQIKALLEYKAFLSEAQPISMVNANTKLRGFLTEKTKILALEDLWIKAFTSVKLDNIHQIWSMPPFVDDTGKTERMLSELDTIWVSSVWEAKKPSRATQSYLRYILHVKPFLDKETAYGTWTFKTVEGYGKIYQKVKPNV